MAIAILMIAIVAPYYSIQQAIVTSYAARDQLIASQLAQEAAEFIHYQRDSNYLLGTSWLTGMDTQCFGQYGCAVDPAAGSFAQCSAPGCAALRLASNGLYTQSSFGSPPVTRFTRTVTMKNMNANEVEVTVTVGWTTERRSYTVKTVDDIYNWL